MLFEASVALEPVFRFRQGEDVADRGFSFLASSSDDVVAYRVTLSLDGDVVGTKDYPDDEDIAHPTDPAKRRIDLAGDPAFPSLDGTYDVELRAIDDAGNASLPLEGALTLDFVAPASPSGFEPF